MNVTGIVAEYNPFHKGHAYHLAEARRITNADFTVVVMSGNFVQRGEPAILDKYTRTRMALLNGADLVLELPVRYATGSAEHFAKGSVSLLNGLGCVDSLCFGSESGDIIPLIQTASVLCEEPEHYKTALKKFLQSGVSFPQAREQALESCGYSSCAAVLSSPNNILGTEYIKALNQSESSIRPVTIQRKGASYHNPDISQEICSATAIRADLSQNRMPETTSVPANIHTLLESAYQKSFPIIANDFSPMLHYRLLTASSWQELTDYFDIPDTLAQRIFRLRHEFTNFDDFTSLIKTKNITELSVRRALLHILLQIPSGINTPLPCGYAHVLGFRKEAAPLLKSVKEKGHLPLVTKLADAPDIILSYELFSKNQKDQTLSLLRQDILASQIYQSAVTVKFNTGPYDELRQQLVIL